MDDDDERRGIIGFFPLFYAAAFIVLSSDPEKLHLFIWRVQTQWIQSQNNKLLDARNRIAELKRRRSDEAKANERVVSIVSAREQIWFNERKMLRRQIETLMSENKSVAAELKEAQGKWRKGEENNRQAQLLVHVLREKVDREAKIHSTEIFRHKTTIIELVSAHRQLEAELNRQLEAAKDEAVRLSTELEKMRKDLEIKDRISDDLPTSKSERYYLLSRHMRGHSLSQPQADEVEQLRVKDEKMEALQWRLNSAEMETKRTQSCPHLQSNKKKPDLTLPRLSSSPEEQQLDERMRNTVVDHSPPTPRGDDDALSSRKKFSSSVRKMDIHALGVAYKIKRLRHQVIMLERLAGKQKCSGEKNALLSLLNKQLDRYQTLQRKTDHLCQRMQENDLGGIARTEEETKKLRVFLEETFELQRYIVSSGQKLTELQAKITSGMEGEEQVESFDPKQFGDSMRSLVREVQRGLEIRISGIIGDLEGTYSSLLCNGVCHSTNK